MYKDKIRIELQQKVEIRFPDFESEMYDTVKEFPEDYIEFLEHFGEGILGEYLRVFPYHLTDRLTRKWREIPEDDYWGAKHLAKYYFKENKDFIKTAILLGDTMDGDQFIYCNKEYYIYCFQGQGFFENVGSKLENIIAYYEKGDHWEPVDISVFTPFDSSLVVRGREFLF